MATMTKCHCDVSHPPRRVVLTGGPGAGKTAVLELVPHAFCQHVDVLPEAASILFRGGFRRGTTPAARAAAQRAIFEVQRELENVSEAECNSALVLCDRGTVDGFAYWPKDGDFWRAVNTTREAELARYAAVIHLLVPKLHHGYDHSNPVRIESAEQAAAIDERLIEAWAGHPRRFFIDSTADFMRKAQEALEIIRLEVPPCCRPKSLFSQ